MYEFLRKRILDPLGMKSAIDSDHAKWSDSDPVGNQHYALGPPRAALLEGVGWLNAAGELAMTAGDLALWDISLIKGTILKPESLRTLTTEVNLKNGGRTGYALGLAVSNTNGRRVWAHGGGTSGFTSSNVTYPDDRVSITVLTNSEGDASSLLGRQIQNLVMAPAEDAGAAAALDHVRTLFTGLQNGQPDRSLLTSDAIAYFTPQVVADYASSLKGFGNPSSFVQMSKADRGGMTIRRFSIKAGDKSLRLSTLFTTEGKIAQYLVYPAQ